MHGPVFSMKKGTQTFIVIGRYNVRSHLVLSSSQADHAQAAIEIMENHWSSLVDRPRLIAASDIMSGGMRVLFISAGSRLRRLHKCVCPYECHILLVQTCPVKELFT